MGSQSRFRYEDVIDAPMGSVSMALDARLRSARPGDGARVDSLTYEFTAERSGGLRVTIEPVSGTATTRVRMEEMGGGGATARLRGWLRCRALMAQLSLTARGIHRSGPPRGPRGGVPDSEEAYRLALVPVETLDQPSARRRR